MKFNTTKKLLALSLSAVMCMGMFTGCSSTEEATTETSTDADGYDVVTFISPTALESFDYLSIYAADALGYFEDEGIKIEYVEQMGSEDMKMLATGQAQFAYPSPGVMFSSIDAGIDNVVAISNYDSIQIFGLAVLEGSGVETFEDLKGKDVALGADSWTTLLASVIGGANISESDLNYITYGTGSYEALASGSVAALGTWLSEYCQLVGQGYDFAYLDGNSVAPQVSNSLCTSQELIDSDPELVARFVNAFTKGLYFCYENVEAATDITLATCPNLEITWEGAVGAGIGDVQQFFGVTEADQLATIEAGVGIFDMTMCQSAIDNLYAAGAIVNEYVAEDYYTNEFSSQISWSVDDVVADSEAYVFVSEQYTSAN